MMDIPTAKDLRESIQQLMTLAQDRDPKSIARTAVLFALRCLGTSFLYGAEALSAEWTYSIENEGLAQARAYFVGELAEEARKAGWVLQELGTKALLSPFRNPAAAAVTEVSFSITEAR